jgi:transcriptional regulator with XRE-family HTH domain
MPRTRSDQIDLYIASRIRAARQERGISQTELGELVGVAFQQIQKYESGKTRVAAGTLFVLSDYFEKPIQWFFPQRKKRQWPGRSPVICSKFGRTWLAQAKSGTRVITAQAWRADVLRLPDHPAKSGGRIGIDIGWTGEPEGSSSRILIETFKDDDVDPNLFKTSFFDVLPDPTIY